MRPDALVVGVTGQVGGALHEVLGPGRVVGTSRRPAEPTVLRCDLEEVAAGASLAGELLRVQPRWVFITSGWTHVDDCEGDVLRAMAINRDGPARIAEAARTHGAVTIYYSTEYVFDGDDGPYAETDPPRPRSVYGMSKLEGEQAVLAADPDALVLRTTVVYGPEVLGKNFAYRTAESLAVDRQLLVPVDQVSSPTYNRDLAAASVGLAETGATGVFNVTGGEMMDRATFARRLARALGRDDRLIIGAFTADLAQRAHRPLRAGLLVDKLRSRLPDLGLHDVESAVADWCERPRGKELSHGR